MRRIIWITTTTGLLLSIFIAWTSGSPLLQAVNESEEDSDEEETQTGKSTQSSVQNITDQELTNKATLFLNRYFNNHGTESPLHIQTNANHTIVITVVPNNSSKNDFKDLTIGTTEGPATVGGDIRLYELLQKYQNLDPLQQQYQIQQALLLQEQELQNVQPALQPQQQSQPQEGQESTLAPTPQPVNLTPSKDLFGYIRKDKLQSLANLEATKTPIFVTAGPADNIEDAILEALSIAGGDSGQGGSPPSSQVNANLQNLLQSGTIPGLSNSNNGGGGGGVHVPSNFGPVFIESTDQSTIPSSIGTSFVNQNNFAPTQPPPPPPPSFAVPPPIRPINPSVVLLQHLVSSGGGNNINANGAADLQQQRPAASGVETFNAVSRIIGSIQDANLGGLVQNSIKLADVPVVQNAAKLATVAILHNVFQGLNPCTYLGNLGNCRPRQPIKKTLPEVKS